MLYLLERVARKFQKPTVFERLTVFGNLELALKTNKGVKSSVFVRLDSRTSGRRKRKGFAEVEKGKSNFVEEFAGRSRAIPSYERRGRDRFCTAGPQDFCALDR